MWLNKIEKTRICATGNGREIIQPTVYADLDQKTEYICFFNDQEFEHTVIEDFICCLEDVRINNSYNSIRVYLMSVGGIADQLILLTDYLNKYPLPITFVVCGDISSCGALLPLMVRDCNIEYTPSSSAMLHLASTWVKSDILYTKNTNPSTNMHESRTKNLMDLNRYLLDNFYLKLDLTEDEIEVILAGKEVYLDRERLETIYTEFKDKQYIEDYFDEDMEYIESEITKTEMLLNQLKAERDSHFTKFEKYLEEVEEDAESEEVTYTSMSNEEIDSLIKKGSLIK